jgi:hypothetical protein
MSTYTKEEWILVENPANNGWMVWDNQEGTKAVVIAEIPNYRRSKKAAAADAKLIAAAPELLEALVDALVWIPKDVQKTFKEVIKKATS